MMRSKQTWLLLLGLFCAGFSFDFEFNPMPFIYLLVGGLFIILSRKNRRIPESVELVSILAGFILAYKLGPHLATNELVFVANSLVIYQLFRLLTPMNDRQRKYSLAVSFIFLTFTPTKEYLSILLTTLFCMESA